jgi:hypothetical protein
MKGIMTEEKQRTNPVILIKLTSFSLSILLIPRMVYFVQSL